MGNRAVQQLIEAGKVHNTLQKKSVQQNLLTGQPDEKYEQEADHIADRVMGMHEPLATETLTTSNQDQHAAVLRRNVDEDGETEKQLEEEENPESAQTKALAGQVTTLTKGDEDYEYEKVLIQGKSDIGKTTTLIQLQEDSGKKELGVSPNFVGYVNSLQGRGNPLPQESRDFFEPRFGYDFRQVRVHTESRAAETARSVNAKAYTVNRNIVFGAGQYSPSTNSGQQLLAHELTHVVQQLAAPVLRNVLQRDPDDNQEAQDREVSYPVKVPRGMKTDAELDRYAEVLIFGKVMNFKWKWTSGTRNVPLLAKEGRTVNYHYQSSFVSQHGGKEPGEALRPPSSNPAYNQTKGEERKAINEEIDKRYWEQSGAPKGEMIEKGDMAATDMWNVYRDEVLNDKKKLQDLPPALKELMGGEPSFKPQDYNQLLRIAEKLKQFSPEDITVYKMLSLRATDNLDLFEKSVDMFLARKAELKEALKKYEAEKKGKAPQSMQDAIEAAWTGFDTSKIGTLSAEDQYDLARQQTWEVTKAQLEYMKNHPGETAVDFAKAATLMNTGETFEAIGKDIAEAANGDANAWARWAGGVGAGAKLSGWMLAVGGVLYVLSWLTGVGELATIAAFMGAMLASTIVLSTAESELRIKAASQAKTPEEFKEQVTKGATARTNVIVLVGLLALALAIRFVAKTYFPEAVTRISKALAKFREKVRIVGKLSEVKAEFTTEMESHRQKLVESGETAKESSIKEADAVDAMSLEEFIEKLESGAGDIFQEAAVQKGQKIPWKALAQTPEGLKAIETYKAQVSEALRTQVPKEIDAMVKEQVQAIDAMLEKVKQATIPDEFEQAIKDHEKFMSDEEVANRGKAREEQVRKEKAEEAEKALEQEIKQFELSKEKAKELILDAYAELDTVKTDLLDVAGTNSGKMVGLDTAVKSESSLTRKISDRIRPRDVERLGMEKAVELSAAKINDALRFTMLFDPKTYVANITAAIATMKAKGYQFVKLWNGWTKSDGTYMGVNATFKTAKGQLFELQFHTPETFNIKTKTHPIYEQARARVTSEAEKAALDQQQRDAYKSVDIPEDIEKIDKIK